MRGYKTNIFRPYADLMKLYREGPGGMYIATDLQIAWGKGAVGGVDDERHFHRRMRGRLEVVDERRSR